MKVTEILYIEVSQPNPNIVCQWLHNTWQPSVGKKVNTSDGIRLELADNHHLSIFVWGLQRTTYLKIFRWGEKQVLAENKIKKEFEKAIKAQFPPYYPSLPDIDLNQNNIFSALESYYPKTVKYFQKMPQGEYDLKRAYWWEKNWRESVKNKDKNINLTPKQVIFKDKTTGKADYDLIYVGGALGAIHAALMAKLGYHVLLIERLKFGRMNREWNISREEFQVLIDNGLFTKKEFESIIAAEYKDGFSKFFDAHNPSNLKAKVLHTPKVLNIAIDTSRLLTLCGQKLKQYGADIWEETEFNRVTIGKDLVTVNTTYSPTGEEKEATGRLLIDAMGTASPIAWQLAGDKTFDSVCPTVGAIVEGFEPEVWDFDYGDVLFSHGDISRGRQLIWELFPAEGKEVTIYLFHYHQVHPDNPGSLLEMYEDFFSILPEYRRCDLDKLTWKKPTFGYIPGRFTVSKDDRKIGCDRILCIGDAASVQSPLIFTGFGSLVRNLGKLTNLLDIALKHNLLDGESLNQIQAYQSNIAVTWMFSKGMMVPTHKTLPPQRINSMLNTFFGLLASEPETADTFIKDRTDWLTFNRLALKAASQNPPLLLWIWQMAGNKDIFKWLGSYFNFTIDAFKNFLFSPWFPQWLASQESWLPEYNPKLWFNLKVFASNLPKK
ncbi:FAD-dependent monooxygenase [Cyanobacterium aponinum UTEX 3222]|uniref:Flavin-dependent dehydrogenase n=1 Tax=Cyanobacterium aponinum 0216 TaxID=2676140 RepID=A0A844GW30_9CHRO|nr:FAD-dependent monooxygenase [Cyanobacterium aponinum]MTF39098.1 flavin-dependent dehydrogenase [Cyanobacterium aponinum 0216]WRL41781.1 FAD-dependent monooxygenase [Cyanobacterium aponinum UTEX 3222]